ncbi:MAG: M50 family metallopeptidase [Bacteroidota bacterium]
MKNNMLIRMIILLVIYLGLRFFGGELGYKILYPINLLVTFLHEFGHALGAWLTGGGVMEIMINQDGSGYAKTYGGSRAIVLMGGYIGSALLGNLLFYIGVRQPRYSGIALYVLAALMVVVAIFKSASLFTTGFLLLFTLGISFVASKESIAREVLMFLGMASILYIIQDFNVGPSSDLAAYADLFVFIPATVWMYIWLAVVVLLTFWNLRMIFKSQ